MEMEIALLQYQNQTHHAKLDTSMMEMEIVLQ